MLFIHSNYSFPQEEVDSLVQEVDSIAQSEVLESSNDDVKEQCVVEEELNFSPRFKRLHIERTCFCRISFTLFNSWFGYCH